MTAAATTVDSFLGGRVEAVQPATGHHRAGLEAVLLSASLPADTDGGVVDLGAGAGVAGLCLAARCPKARILLIEREAFLVECARKALARPANRGFAPHVSIEQRDIFAPDIDAVGVGLRPAAFDEVLINPPFYDPTANSASPQAARARAHLLKGEGLAPWLRFAATLLKPRGRVSVIFRADGLDAVLAGVSKHFGAIDILPIHPRAILPAHRILVSGRKVSRARLQILPPLILHGETGGAFLPEIDEVLRAGRGLDEVHRAWQERR